MTTIKLKTELAAFLASVENLVKSGDAIWKKLAEARVSAEDLRVELDMWSEEVKGAFASAFGQDAPVIQQFDKTGRFQVKGQWIDYYNLTKEYLERKDFMLSISSRMSSTGVGLFDAEVRKDLLVHRAPRSEETAEERGQALDMPTVPDSNSVFVVKGRFDPISAMIEDFLRVSGLNVVTWERATELTRQRLHTTHPYIHDILLTGMQQAQVIVILLTPDELTWLRPQCRKPDDELIESSLAGQCRPNVYYELGLARGKFWAEALQSKALASVYNDYRTIIVQVGNIKLPSDISGQFLCRLTGHPGGWEQLLKLVNHSRGIATHEPLNEAALEIVSRFRTTDVQWRERLEIALNSDRRLVGLGSVILGCAALGAWWLASSALRGRS